MKIPFPHLYPRDTDQTEEIFGKVTINLSSEVEKILGPAGRLISGSKSSYQTAHRDHRVLFNACIFDEKGQEVWFGDIDLTEEEDKLKKVAAKIGKITVTPEHPFRWDGLNKKNAKENAERIYTFQ